MPATPSAIPAPAPLPDFSIVSSSTLPNSLAELRGLASSLSNFFARYDELQSHLDSIQDAMARRLRVLENGRPASPRPIAKDDDSSRTELELLCEAMNGRGLRRYVSAALPADEKDNAAALREEVRLALRRAPEMGKFVLDCIGRFYLQGSKAYERESPMVAVRRSCIVVLEAFVLANESGAIDASVRKEAETAAMSWKVRLIHEGGIAKCKEIDARGLLLFLSSFGIPQGFGKDDLLKLMNRIKFRKNFEIFRASTILQKKLEELIQGMVKNGKHDAAVDLVCTFGLEEKFPPIPLLTSFLDDVSQNAKKSRREGQGSGVAMKSANEKELAALKSVVKCIEKHHIDPAKLLNLKVDEKITKLEKDLANYKKLNEPKRKAVEQGGTPFMHNIKRQRPSNIILSPQWSPYMPPNVDQSIQLHGLAPMEGYDSRHMGFIERYPGGMASPNVSHSMGHAVAGEFIGGVPAAVSAKLAGHPFPSARNGGMDQFAAEVVDVYPRESSNGPLPGSRGAVSLVDNRAPISYGWHQGDLSVGFTEDTSRRSLLQHYYNGYMEARQGYNGPPA